MKIKRPERTHPFVAIDERIFTDARITAKAKAIHAYIYGKPDGWTTNVRHIINTFKEGETAVYNAVDELLEHGYWERQRDRKGDGTLGPATYVIHELPAEKTASTANEATSGFSRCGSSTSGSSRSGKQGTNSNYSNSNYSNNGSTGSLRSPSEPEAAGQASPSGGSGEAPSEKDEPSDDPPPTDSDDDAEKSGSGEDEHPSPRLSFNSLAEQRQHFAEALSRASGGEPQAILREVCERLYGFTPGYKEIGGWKKRVVYGADDPARRAMKLLYRYAHADIDGHPLHYISAAEARRRREGEALPGQKALPVRPEHGEVYTGPELQFYAEARDDVEEDHFHGAGTDPKANSEPIYRYFDPEVKLKELGLALGQRVETPRGNAATVIGWQPMGVKLQCDATGDTGLIGTRHVAGLAA